MPWADSDQPEVWQCARRREEFSSAGEKGCMSCDHNRRAARILAISMKKFMPMPQKKDSRGAKSSIANPALRPARTYSMPSARV